MPINAIIVLIGLAVASIWIGFEIEPRRDPVAWIFLIVVPLALINAAFFIITRLKSKRRTEGDQS
jgi:hypothetical protein